MKVSGNVSSKLLDRKWKEKDFLLHKRKLREIKSTVRSNAPPYHPESLVRNAKKDAMLERKR